ncbi:aspartate--tRNA ligase msd1 [Savitreella phatthalungensis]
MSGAVARQTLKGWLELPKRRVSSNLRFFRLRYFDERSNEPRSCQLVSRHPPDTKISKLLSSLTPESCVAVECSKSLRPDKDQRDGEGDKYEYEIEGISVLNRANERLPFLPNAEGEVDPLVRAQHRHIDLRSSKLGGALRRRAQIRRQLQRSFEDQGFLEVETPLLFKSTPEGAREFLVPTRRKGRFFALPQSPQQYKQLLMAGGVHRYFQLARCFRDEDSRADRQPEFTQLDLEMGFAGAEDVMSAVAEAVLSVDAPFNAKQPADIKRISYMEAMKRYGSDKPDLRFDMEIQTVGVKEKDCSTVEVIRSTLIGSASNKMISELRDHVKEFGDGLYVIYGKTKSEINLERMFKLDDKLSAHPDEILILAERPNMLFGGSTKLGQVRLLLQSWLERHDLTNTPRRREPLNLCWVTDFPLFSPADEQTYRPSTHESTQLASTHHPFTAPHPDDVHLLETDPLKVRGLHYDLVLNGVEIGGGSARIHDPSMQTAVLRDHLRLSADEVARFDHLVRVLGSGCPPHAGFALGFDRFVATILGASSIRDVLAFPKTTGGQDALVGSPSQVNAARLADYHLQELDRK